MATIKGIKYIAPLFDSSGYAQASRGYVLALHKMGIPITIDPVSFEKASPDLGDEGRILYELQNKAIDYNIVITHLTPEFWAKHYESDKINIGYTVWETDKLHPDWPGWINKYEAVMCSSDWNVEVFKKSGVTKPVFSIPHGIDMTEFENVNPYSVSGIKEGAFKFYSILQFTERKHPVALIKSYWYAFQNKENVALILKTYRSNFNESEKDAIRKTIKRLKEVTPMDNYPPIYLVLNMLSREEILGLHKTGDCYISLDRGEGFGLSPFEAGSFAKPIIVTGYGGATEYAKDTTSFKVGYTLTPVSGMPWSSSIKSVIYTEAGFKNINEVKKRDKVFNKNGKSKEVIKIGSRPLRSDELMYKLTYMSMYEDLEVTNYHKLYVVKDNRVDKIQVSDINVGDYLLVPKPSTTCFNLDKIDMVNYVNKDMYEEDNGKIVYKNNNSKKYSINRFVNVNNDLAKLIGFYLSEGCVYTNKSFTSFSFSGDELDTLVTECSNLFKNVFGIDESSIKLRVYKDRNGCELGLNNKFISEFFKKEFYTGSKIKTIPDKFCLHNDKEFRKNLLSYYWLGDGHVRKFRVVNNKKLFSRECVASSASRDLIMSLRSLMLSLNILPSLSKNERKDGRINYIISVNNPLFDEIIGLPQRDNNSFNYHYYNYDENYFAVRLKNKKPIIDFEGDVWSISVECDVDEDIKDGGSYILNGIASSNSPWYKGDQLWAEPNCLDAVNHMRYVYNNQDIAKSVGNSLYRYINNNLTWDKVGQKMIDTIRGL